MSSWLKSFGGPENRAETSDGAYGNRDNGNGIAELTKLNREKAILEVHSNHSLLPSSHSCCRKK